MALTNVTKKYTLDIPGVEDLPLSLLVELSERYLSARQIDQLVTHREN